MASRRKKATKLSAREHAEFMAAATELHEVCRRPLLATLSDDYQALMISTRREAITKVTGDVPPWMKTPPSWAHPGVSHGPEGD